MVFTWFYMIYYIVLQGFLQGFFGMSLEPTHEESVEQRRQRAREWLQRAMEPIAPAEQGSRIS